MKKSEQLFSILSDIPEEYLKDADSDKVIKARHKHFSFRSIAAAAALIMIVTAVPLAVMLGKHKSDNIVSKNDGRSVSSVTDRFDENDAYYSLVKDNIECGGSFSAYPFKSVFLLLETSEFNLYDLCIWNFETETLKKVYEFQNDSVKFLGSHENAYFKENNSIRRITPDGKSELYDWSLFDLKIKNAPAAIDISAAAFAAECLTDGIPV